MISHKHSTWSCLHESPLSHDEAQVSLRHLNSAEDRQAVTPARDEVSPVRCANTKNCDLHRNEQKSNIKSNVFIWAVAKPERPLKCFTTKQAVTHDTTIEILKHPIGKTNQMLWWNRAKLHQTKTADLAGICWLSRINLCICCRCVFVFNPPK